MTDKLKEIKELNSGLSYDKYKYLEDEHIEWLIKQAEKVERYEKALKDIAENREDTSCNEVAIYYEVIAEKALYK